ncbi:MAG: hypothetical protein DCC75_12925 [Proteobacteria bacterium]|nr:MAG: hypothetical protein DCC75_12925 [Pseudomonadota bacterium]
MNAASGIPKKAIAELAQEVNTRGIELALNEDNYLIAPKSVFNYGLHILVFLFACALMIYLTVKFDWSVQYFGLGQWLGYKIRLGLPLFGIFPLIALVWVVRSIYDELYILTDEYALKIMGRCSLTGKTIRLNYVNMRGVNIEKNLYQRLFDVGDLVVESDVTTAGSQIRMKGISNPRFYKDLLQKKMAELIAPTTPQLA